MVNPSALWVVYYPEFIPKGFKVVQILFNLATIRDCYFFFFLITGLPQQYYYVRYSRTWGSLKITSKLMVEYEYHLISVILWIKNRFQEFAVNDVLVPGTYIFS